MKVLILPADLGGCGYYRLIWATEQLQKQGYDIEVEWPAKDSGFEIHFAEDGVTITDFKLPGSGNPDVVVMQRVSHMWHLQVIPLFRKRGIAVVIDMDDDLTCIHPRNTAYWNYNTRSNTPFSWKNAEMACKDATYVTVSTPSLLPTYAKHHRGQVIDNYIPASYLDITSDRDDEVFGWAGTVDSHPTDLQVVGKAVPQLQREGYRFRVIGPGGEGVKTQLRMDALPEATGIVKMDEWAQAVSQLSLAMAPLEQSQFNASKSRLKVLEANSVGVPYVASPRSEYRRYHKASGGGLLADSPKEWYAHIKRLMDDESLRKELGEQGREYCRTQTIEGNAWRWLEAWQTAYEIQRSSK